MMEKQSVLIIGAGLGGLFTGAILAKEGFKVTLIEKNTTVGGGLQSFKRFGEVFDTGMHIIGGMIPGGNVYRICKYLGILDKVEVKDVDPDCSDEVIFGEDGVKYRVASTRENYIKTLIEQFPHEADGIKAYTDAIFRIADKIALFNLRPFDGFVAAYTDEMVESADAFIAKYIKDHRLRALLAYLNPLYGGKGGQTPAYIHALIHSLYISGASRFKGGSYKFAEVLADFIRENGGEVFVNEAVTHVAVVDKNITEVETSKGRKFNADYYISAIHPCALLKIIDEKAFPKSYRTRLEEIPNSYSAFALYIKFKPDSFPYINHSIYYMTIYDKIWDFGKDNETWPIGFLFMTPPHGDDDKYARTALVTAPMSIEMAKKWENTTVGRRGEDYEKWKEECAEKIVAMLENVYPNIRECIDKVNTSSPLTIRDYYASKEGCISGFSKNCHNMALSQVPVGTKVKNLFLTGQNINLHGFCGVPLTAINTSEAILGANYVINKINAIDKD